MSGGCVADPVARAKGRPIRLRYVHRSREGRNRQVVSTGPIFDPRTVRCQLIGRFGLLVSNPPVVGDCSVKEKGNQRVTRGVLLRKKFFEAEFVYAAMSSAVPAMANTKARRARI